MALEQIVGTKCRIFNFFDVGPADIKYGIQIKRIKIKEFFSLNMSVNSWASNLFTSFVVRVGFNAYLKQCKVNKGFCMILKVTSAKKDKMQGENWKTDV